jgi:hypothetical protein
MEFVTCVSQVFSTAFPFICTRYQHNDLLVLNFSILVSVFRIRFLRTAVGENKPGWPDLYVLLTYLCVDRPGHSSQAVHCTVYINRPQQFPTRLLPVCHIGSSNNLENYCLVDAYHRLGAWCHHLRDIYQNTQRHTVPCSTLKYRVRMITH